MVKTLQTDEDFKKLINSKGFQTVIVGFFTSFEIPELLVVQKKFESYSDQNGIVTFGLSTNEDTMGEQGVVQWPTFTAYQNGNKVEELLNDDLEILDAYINKYRNKSITNDVAGGCNVS